MMLKKKYCCSTLLVIGCFIVNIASAQDDEMGEAGLLEFKNSSGDIYSALHLSTQVSMRISGMVAEVSYVQNFRNDSDDWVEGKYLFPLPETAAVNAMQMRLSDRIVTGVIKERQEAKAIYQQAKASGQRASLVEQQRPNMFTQNVANIAPGEIIEVSITYLQKVKFSQGQFNVRLPLTITPRYIPGTELLAETELLAGAELPKNSEIELADTGWGWAVPTDQVVDADFISPHMINGKRNSLDEIINPVSINIELDAGLELSTVDSAYHQIDIGRKQQKYMITLSRGQVAMDRDFVLHWQPVAKQVPTAALFTEELDNDTYLMLMLLPPEQARQKNALAREVIFIIDTSGSMGGSSITQAKASLQMALQTLSPADRFNIVEFNSGFSMLAPQSMPASRQYLRTAQDFVARLDAGGGTEMHKPLNAVLSQAEMEGYLKQVIFITDGSVGNEQALFNLIHTELGNARLFTVGIGSAPNSYFMRKAAEFGRGTFTYVGNNKEVSERMSGLFRQLESPVLRDIEVKWPQNLEVEMWPERIPDLYYGQPLMLTAKVSELKGSVEMSGQSSANEWGQKIALNTGGAQHSGISSLWARDKIAALLDEKVAGAEESLIKPLVLEVALTHRLVSPYTSFVAVEEKVVRAAEEGLNTEEVPNLVAQGQTAMPHTYPKGALGLRWNILLACLALLLAYGLYWWTPRHANKTV